MPLPILFASSYGFPRFFQTRLQIPCHLWLVVSDSVAVAAKLDLQSFSKVGEVDDGTELALEYWQEPLGGQ